MSNKQEWVWMPHAGHFILGDKCLFRMATYLGNGILVSTVGELWNDQNVRRIHAEVHDNEWAIKYAHLKGDTYDDAYRKRFGFENLGAFHQYETMVFKAIPGESKCSVCLWVTESGQNHDFKGYTEGKAAYAGHMAMCEKWATKTSADLKDDYYDE